MHECLELNNFICHKTIIYSFNHILNRLEHEDMLNRGYMKLFNHESVLHKNFYMLQLFHFVIIYNKFFIFILNFGGRPPTPLSILVLKEKVLKEKERERRVYIFSRGDSSWEGGGNLPQISFQDIRQASLYRRTMSVLRLARLLVQTDTQKYPIIFM